MGGPVSLSLSLSPSADRNEGSQISTAGLLIAFQNATGGGINFRLLTQEGGKLPGERITPSTTKTRVYAFHLNGRIYGFALRLNYARLHPELLSTP